MDRDKLYEYLTQQFANFARGMNDEAKTDLDGILWKLSDELPGKIACAQPSKAV